MGKKKEKFPYHDQTEFIEQKIKEFNKQAAETHLYMLVTTCYGSHIKKFHEEKGFLKSSKALEEKHNKMTVITLSDQPSTFSHFINAELKALLKKIITPNKELFYQKMLKEYKAYCKEFSNDKEFNPWIQELPPIESQIAIELAGKDFAYEELSPHIA